MAEFKPDFVENTQIFDAAMENEAEGFDPDFGKVNTVNVGQNGATFTPSVSEDGVISWTNDRELENPAPVDIRGPKGDAGVDVKVAVEDIEGGHRVTITDVEGAKTFDVMDGKSGGGGAVAIPSLPSEDNSNKQLVTDYAGNIQWIERTHYTAPMFYIQWDGVINDRVSVPLDAFGAPGYFLVHQMGNLLGHQLTAENLNYSYVTYNDGEIRMFVAEDFTEVFPGVLAPNGFEIVAVTDAEQFATAMGIQIPEGLYFLFYPAENMYIKSLTGHEIDIRLNSKYAPPLEQAYPSVATKSFFFDMFNGNVPDEAFTNDKTITNLKTSVFVNIGRRAFANCDNLIAVDLPEVAHIKVGAFYNCDLLETVALREIKNIDNVAFGTCTNLKKVIIRGTNAVPKIYSDINYKIFKGTPISRGTGYIYVPASMVDTYRKDANWSEYASQFRALEDYTVDGTITGELDETKI